MRRATQPFLADFTNWPHERQIKASYKSNAGEHGLQQSTDTSAPAIGVRFELAGSICYIAARSQPRKAAQ
jgi:hypothetical protein